MDDALDWVDLVIFLGIIGVGVAIAVATHVVRT